FWKFHPVLWFAQVEAQFQTPQIKSDHAKYYAIVATLNIDILQQEKQLERLLTGLDLDIKKPSCLLPEMKNLSANKISDNVLRTLWLQRMPQQVQLTLSVNTDADVTKMAEMADR
ncbi:hypothetical protein BDFB_014598, partial [Asbolus verrucosus]